MTAFLHGIGYELKAKAHPYGSALGTLTHNGRRVDVYVSFSTPISNTGQKGHVSALRLSTEFDVPHEIPTSPGMPGGGMFYVPKDHTFFFPSLGRTVLARADIDLSRKAAPSDVKA